MIGPIATPTSIAELDDLITAPPDAVVDIVKQSPGRFAVLGAGGKMGYHVSLMLSRALEAAGRDERVLVVSRFGTDAGRRPFENDRFEILSADLSDPESVSKLPTVPNVIYLAGLKFGSSSAPELLHRMNIQMPQLIVEHFHESRIVALSTGCVYSFTTPESGGAREDGELDPPGDYAKSCIGREQAFDQAAEQSGTRSVLVRLNYSIDLRYGVLVDVAQKVLNNQSIDVQTGYANVIWQGDAVSQIIQCLPHAAAPPFAINISGPETLRIRDVAAAFGKRFGRNVTFTGQESNTAWLSNTEKARQLFGKPSVDVPTMIEWISDWLEVDGETLNKPTHFENRDGKY